MRFFYNTIVWNKTYLDLFIWFTIPSILTNKKINNHESEYYLAITFEDYEYLKVKKNYQFLEKKIKINVYYIDDFVIKNDNKYEVVGNIQKLFLIKAFEKGFEYFFLIYPDSIYSSNFIDRSRDILKEKDIIVCPSINVNSRDLYSDEFKLNNFSNKYMSLVAIENLSYFHQSFIFENLNKLNIPIIIRKQKNDNLIVNGFYYHPAVFKLKLDLKLLTDFKNSIDEEHIYKSYQYIDSYYIPKNSNDLLIISIEDQISERNQNAKSEINSKLNVLSKIEKIDLIINYAEAYTIKINRDIFAQDYEIIKHKTKAYKSEGTSIINLIYSELFLSDNYILLHAKKRHIARKNNIYAQSNKQMVSKYKIIKDRYGEMSIKTQRKKNTIFVISFFYNVISNVISFFYNYARQFKTYRMQIKGIKISLIDFLYYIILRVVHKLRDNFPSIYYYLRNRFPSKNLKNKIKQKNIKHLNFMTIVYLLIFKK